MLIAPLLQRPGSRAGSSCLFRADDALRHDPVGDDRAGDQRSAVVVELDQVAALDALGSGILDADEHMLAALDVLLEAHVGLRHLRVHPVVGVRADDVHLAGPGVAEELRPAPGTSGSAGSPAR